MENLEVSAKTVDEAIELALNQLGVGRSEVEVEVVAEGRQGILGLGAEEARVRVRLLPKLAAVDVPGRAKEVLERLLDSMKVPATVQIRELPGEGVDEDSSPVVLDISGYDLGILIGWRGETLSSLQYIVNLIVSRQMKANAGITIDVERYRERRYEALRSLALRLAEQVKSTGRLIMLEPMPSNERRIVHLALRDEPEVVTQSVGEGQARKVSISLRSP